MSRFERWALISVLFLAAYLRLNHLDWTEFKLDEANLSRLALNMARGIDIPLTGIGSSTGIVNLPLAAWLLAIPYAIAPNPIVATAFVALLNVAAVAGCYALARRWFSTLEKSATRVASYVSTSYLSTSYPSTSSLLSTLLFAVAPWAVIHSRKIWAQNLLPPFVVAWAWTGWLACVERRPRALIAHALALAACMHLHYSGLWLLPVSVAWGIAFARRLRWRTVLAAVGVFAATFAPFVMGDIVQGAPNLSRLLSIVQQPATVDGEALHLAWLMITGQEIHSLAGPQEFANFLSSVPGGETGFALVGAIGVLMIGGAAVALAEVVRAVRRRSLDNRAAASLMMVTWLVLPVLLQTRHSLPVFTHYFIILYPVPFVVVGWFVGWLNGRWRNVAVVALAGIALLQVVQSTTLQQFIAERATPGGFGVPVGATLRIAAEAVRVSRGELDGAEIVVYTEGDRPGTHEWPSVFDVLLPPDAPRRFVDLASGTRLFPRDAAAVVYFSPLGLPLPDDALLGQVTATAPLRRGEAAAHIGAWPGRASVPAPCDESRPLGRWQNGVTLLGVRASGDWRGSDGWLEVCYAVETQPGAADYHWFTHVIGPDGERRAQIDGAGYPAGSWRVGDIVLLRFGPYGLPANAPIGPYVLRVGMYAYPDIVTVPRREGGGAPDYVEVDLGDVGE